MKLTVDNIKNRELWEEFDIKLPNYNIKKVRENTKKNPTWLHIGAGNIFRIFMGQLAQNLLNKDIMDTGIVVAETFDMQIIDKVFNAYDHLSMAVTMHSDASLEKEVIASIVDSMKVSNLSIDDKSGDHKTYLDIFANQSLQMVSLTVTEKGYALKNINGELLPVVEADIKNGLKGARHVMSILTLGLYNRYLAGGYKVAVLSTDNCSHNGDKVKEAVNFIAKEWIKEGLIEQGFLDYINDNSKVSFPLSMIDKITPRPSLNVKNNLESLGVEDMDIIVTDKNTYTSAFVNAEKTQYLVVEDNFPNGRPELEKAGVIFCDRETVNKVETMKVSTCLNPLHTALAVSGCILGYTKVSDEMKDRTLVKWIKKIGYDEGLKVVVDPKILDPKQFIDEVVEERFVNPNIPDTPQRIATDTSQKVGVRFGKTIKAYVNDENLDVKNLVGISLAISTWLRYLLGVNDEGAAINLSPDPLKDSLKSALSQIRFPNNGRLSKNEVKEVLAQILSNEEIFGQDLTNIEIGDMIVDYFYQMISDKGAVRATIEKNIE